jgi:hypothetical protein
MILMNDFKINHQKLITWVTQATAALTASLSILNAAAAMARVTVSF